MKNSNETDALNELILAEELKYDFDLAQLKDQFHLAYESIKPINLVKSLFHQVTASPEIKNDLVSNVIGLGTGLLSKKLFLGTSLNPIKKIVATVFEFAIANMVSKHTLAIKLIGGKLLNYFSKKQKLN
jgi:hypothetical protein